MCLEHDTCDTRVAAWHRCWPRSPAERHGKSFGLEVPGTSSNLQLLAAHRAALRPMHGRGGRGRPPRLQASVALRVRGTGRRKHSPFSLRFWSSRLPVSLRHASVVDVSHLFQNKHSKRGLEVRECPRLPVFLGVKKQGPSQKASGTWARRHRCWTCWNRVCACGLLSCLQPRLGTALVQVLLLCRQELRLRQKVQQDQHGPGGSLEVACWPAELLHVC